MRKQTKVSQRPDTTAGRKAKHGTTRKPDRRGVIERDHKNQAAAEVKMMKIVFSFVTACKRLIGRSEAKSCCGSRVDSYKKT